MNRLYPEPRSRVADVLGVQEQIREQTREKSYPEGYSDGWRDGFSDGVRAGIVEGKKLALEDGLDVTAAELGQTGDPCDCGEAVSDHDGCPLE